MRTGPILDSTLTFAVLSAEAGGSVMPKRWHDQSSARSIEGQVAEKAFIVADFDGNGLIEGASLAITDDGKKQGLLVFRQGLVSASPQRT